MKEGWKPWTTFDGAPVLVPEKFNTDPEPNGDILMYPEGDKAAPPSGRMPRGGFYFDAIVRQPPIDDDHLNVEDNLEEFSFISESELEHFRVALQRRLVDFWFIMVYTPGKLWEVHHDGKRFERIDATTGDFSQTISWFLLPFRRQAVEQEVPDWFAVAY
jgi:hypothetical protein